MDRLYVFWVTTASVFGLGVPGRFFCELSWNYAMIFYNIVVHKFYLGNESTATTAIATRWANARPKAKSTS